MKKRKKAVTKRTKQVKKYAIKQGFVLPHGYEAIVRKKKPKKAVKKTVKKRK